jgi:hypothetical protein
MQIQTQCQACVWIHEYQRQQRDFESTMSTHPTHAGPGFTRTLIAVGIPETVLFVRTKPAKLLLIRIAAVRIEPYFARITRL